MHDYIPDFIVPLQSEVHLIIGTKGYDPLEDVPSVPGRRSPERSS